MYVDKSAWDSKKFKASLAGMLAIALTAILAPRLGPVTGTVVDYLSNYGAEILIAGLTALYIAVQGWIDKTMAAKTAEQAPPAVK